MSFWDDATSFAHDVLSGNLGKAVGDVGHAVHDVVGGGGATGSVMNTPASGVAGTLVPGIPGNVGIPGHVGGSCSGGLAPPPPAMGFGGSECCDRYRFDSGFLIDGATGTVWQYDGRSKSFEEVPVNRSKSKQALVNALVENKLAALRSQYEQKELALASPGNRQKLLAAFEKEQLAPLRDVARATQY